MRISDWSSDVCSSEVLSMKYQTAPLAEDMYINGPIEADVWLSTTAADASLSVRVDDVDENGVAKSLANGIQTASPRMVDESRRTEERRVGKGGVSKGRSWGATNQ